MRKIHKALKNEERFFRALRLHVFRSASFFKNLADGILHDTLEVQPCDLLHLFLAHAHLLKAGKEVRNFGAVCKTLRAGAAGVGHGAHGVGVVDELEEVEAAADLVV